jgi:hypothetical protein
MLEIKPLDKIIIAILLILSFIPAGVLMIIESNDENNNIVIKVDNNIIKEISLNNIDSSKIYEFSFNDNIGYVEVNNGRVRMLEMNKEICPNAICSDTGWIDKGYQSIVCLPNKIIVTIEGNEDNDIDYITY